MSSTEFLPFLKKYMPTIGKALLIPVLMFIFLPWQLHLFSFFLLPLLLIQIPASVFSDERSGSKRLKKGFLFGVSSYGKTLLLVLLLSGFLFLFLQPIAFVFSLHDTNEAPLMRDLLDLVADFISRIAQWFTDEPIIFSNILRQAVYILVLLLIIPFLALILLFAFLSELEKKEARGLKNAFITFGQSIKNSEKFGE
jgi:hypothetical protein